MSFESLSLSDELLRAVRAASYEAPTPIQTKAIPPALEGRDVLGCAQTGTGKTAAFVLPTLQRLMASREARAAGPAPVRCLVLTPTRELAAQIGETFREMGKFLPLRSTVIFGGVGYDSQERAMRAGVDVLVATPGRLLDHLQRRTVNLSKVSVLILDEADQMLDMGFIHDVRRIVAQVPKARQTLFFSATMPASIRALADEWLASPVEVSVAPPATTAERVAQSLFFVETQDKRPLLESLLARPEVTRALVFSRTKHGANKIARWLDAAGIRAEPIHGNKSQNARERALASFKKGATRVLVATDLAARGLDIDEVSHVVNFDLPNVPEVYVHRIGRTARAGAEGIAWSFCNVEEREYLRDIEKITRQRIPVVDEHPYRSNVPAPVATAPGERAGARPAGNGGNAGNRNGGARPGGGRPSGQPSNHGGAPNRAPRPPANNARPSGEGGARSDHAGRGAAPARTAGSHAGSHGHGGRGNGGAGHGAGHSGRGAAPASPARDGGPRRDGVKTDGARGSDGRGGRDPGRDHGRDPGRERRADDARRNDSAPR